MHYFFSENYQDGPTNISQDNSNKSSNRRWQDKLDASTLSSENCRVSEERLSRIANWHHLPRYIHLMFRFWIKILFRQLVLISELTYFLLLNRVSMERAKLMRSISNDHIPSPFSSSFHVNYQNYRNQKRYNR